MRILVGSLTLLLVAVGLTLARAGGHQPPPQPDPGDCRFTVHGEPVHPAITAPDEIVPLVYVVEQPDSPIEIVSVDLTGMQVNLANEELTHKDCVHYTVRNRSDRSIEGAWIELGFNGIGGSGAFGPPLGSPLASGASVDIKACNTGGHVSGVPGDRVRLLVSVSLVKFAGCAYKPSIRIPRSLGIPFVR